MSCACILHRLSSNFYQMFPPIVQLYYKLSIEVVTFSSVRIFVIMLLQIITVSYRVELMCVPNKINIISRKAKPFQKMFHRTVLSFLHIETSWIVSLVSLILKQNQNWRKQQVIKALSFIQNVSINLPY